MSKLKRLEELVPVIVSGSKYGSDLVFVRWEFGDKSDGDVQFASTVLFLSAVLQNKTEVVKLPLIVKFELSNSEVRRWFMSEEQFYNEVYAYEHILPFLNTNNVIDELYPVYYYGYCSSGSCPEDDVVVLQDLRPDGFKLSDEVVFLDFDHCAVAMKQIGRYHALSYNAKQHRPREFYEKIKSLKECRFLEEREEENYYLFCTAFKRAVKPFLDRGEYTDIIKRFLEKGENANSLLTELVKPEEPIAVICHGDFCRNNILFRYDSNNTPVDAKLFDIATTRYASPVIDLSFFLFLNTTYELRKQHWDDFLKIYHDAMVQTLPDVVMPSLEDVKEEMLKKAVYGFAIASFFLPALFCEEKFEPESVCSMSPQERSGVFDFLGGQRATDAVAAIFKELIERGYVT